MDKVRRSVFPAWAGVEPASVTALDIAQRIPRVGGGRPLWMASTRPAMSYSPRGRG